MEYKDYKTDEPISREQYIKNGLERGEHLATLSCGCVMIQDRTAGAYIVFCHKHEAAPDCYEALKRIIGVGLSHYNQDDIDSANQALAKAEGR